MANKIERDWLSLVGGHKVSVVLQDHLTQRIAQGACCHLNFMGMRSQAPLVCERPRGHEGRHEEPWVATWAEDGLATLRWCASVQDPTKPDDTPTYGTKAQQKEQA